MDVVYVTKGGDNPELRYSLRSLQNVKHGRVWVFGSAPPWLNTESVKWCQSPQRGTPYQSTRSHIAAACNHPAVSDPFTLWNDDFYAMKSVGEIPVLHRGSLDEMLEEAGQNRTPWWKGISESTHLLHKMGFENPLCYDVHAPLVVHKAAMLDTIPLAKKVRSDAFALRSVYGNVAGIRGTRIPDPKVLRRTDPFPRGPWLSSQHNLFISMMEPVLRYTFPDPSPYEKV